MSSFGDWSLSWGGPASADVEEGVGEPATFGMEAGVQDCGGYSLSETSQQAEPEQPTAETATFTVSASNSGSNPIPIRAPNGTHGRSNASVDGFPNAPDQHAPVSVPGKHACLELLLRKLLLGEELVNTHFYLYSARSLPSRRIVKPRVVFANNDLLAKESKYFLELLSSDVDPADPSLSDLTGDNDVPAEARVDEYGYASDSDLDDCDDPVPEAPKGRSAMIPPTTNGEARPRDEDELSDDGSESVSSDMFVMSPEEPRAAELFSVNIDDAAGSVASSRTAVQEASSGNKALANDAAISLRSFGGRQILVKDTAFQTWYTLLNYLSTGKITFLPLTSATSGRSRKSTGPTSSLDEPKCSAKSMYHLACKVGLDRLRDDALAHIRSNLTEHNILKEISCSLVSKHSELLEMELDVLYSHIASPPVIEKYPELVRRIMNKELPHGAEVIIKTHEKFVRELRPVPPMLPHLPPLSPPAVSPSPASESAGPALIQMPAPAESYPSSPPRTLPSFSFPGPPPPPDNPIQTAPLEVNEEEDPFFQGSKKKKGGSQCCSCGKKKKK